jgi:hypothetical protein
MRLVRTAVLSFTPSWREPRGWKAKYGEVEVDTLYSWRHETGPRDLIFATIPLKALPGLDANGYVDLPRVERETAEWALTTICDALAVHLGAARTISSPIPWAALIPDSSEERAFLNASTGIDPSPKEAMSFAPGVPLETLLSTLEDRRDGVALLAEALAQQHPTGRFNDLMRVFERAFAKNAAHVGSLLCDFLCSGPVGFQRDEIDGWVGDLRNRAVHANRKPGPVFGRTIRPLLRRVELAAYDTLLNKSVWHAKSSQRRSLWVPTAITPPPGGRPVVQVGSRDTMECQLLDSFGVFPLDLTGKLDSLPDEWWTGSQGTGQLSLAVHSIEVRRALGDPGESQA